MNIEIKIKLLDRKLLDVILLLNFKNPITTAPSKFRQIADDIDDVDDTLELYSVESIYRAQSAGTRV
jgi:hypothetical protein